MERTLEELWQFPDAAVAKPETQELTLEERFRRLAATWELETKHLSSPTKMIAHPCYQEIMKLPSEEIVPILLHDMQRTGRTWFWALAALTKQNPVDPRDAGKVKRMIGAWVKWGRREHLL
jgi:hypothetical protein